MNLSMSHFSKNPHPSLLHQLLGWTLVVLLALAVLGGSYTFWNNYQQINRFQDDNLKNIARLIADNGLTHLNTLQHYQTADNEGGLNIDVMPILSANGNPHQTAVTDNPFNQIPQGLSSQMILGESWQVYRLDTASARIIVRQRMDLQADLAEASAIESLLPIVLAIIVLGLVLSYLIWRLFKPVKNLAISVTSRQDFDLSPLTLTGLPKEVVAFGVAINQLLAQVATNVAQQQRFIADASHELRSPLTAISLQLQRLQRLTDEPKLQEGLNKLAVRVKRNQNLVEQLLTLARLNTHPEPLTPVALYPIIEQTVNLLLPIINHKNIQLHVQLTKNLHTFAINADSTAVTLLIKNLLQNAVLYTPNSGDITIILAQLNDISPLLLNTSQAIINHYPPQTLATLPPNTPVLQIIDTGQGISPHHYQQAFEPFVRLTADTDTLSNRSDTSEEIKGTGLGLSIVKTVCEQSQINLYLSPSVGSTFNPTSHQGLCVSLVFFG